MVVRADPVVYMVHVALRPDNAWNLISYPEYCNYTSPGDQAGFRRIDCNPWAVMDKAGNPTSGKGFNTIQGIVILDDEDDENCTEMLLGFSKSGGKKLREWASRLEDRGAATTGSIFNLQGKGVWTVEDAEYFNQSFVPLPTEAGTLRISSPLNPYGSPGPSTILRRAVMPRLVSWGEDRKLDSPAAGSWDDISKCYRLGTAPPTTPSGSATNFDTQPFPFPAGTPPLPPSPLGRAVHAQLPFSHPAVIADICRLVSQPEEEVQRIRRSNIDEAWRNFARFIQQEAEAFGDASFFRSYMDGQLVQLAANGLLEQEGVPSRVDPRSFGSITDQAPYSGVEEWVRDEDDEGGEDGEDDEGYRPPTKRRKD